MKESENVADLHAFYSEQLESQRDMLSCAIESLVKKKKELESALKQVERRNYELSQISSRTFHDMREPMVALVGLVDMLRSEAKSESSMQLVSMIEVSINKLDKFALALAEYVKLIQRSYEPSKINLPQFISSKIASLNDQISLKGITIDLRPLGDKTHTTYDTKRLEVILKNLLINAVRFRDEKKDKTTIRVHYKVKKGRTILVIEDNGIGISKTAYRRVTDMFYRGSSRSTGSGLGLYMTKTLIHDNGGAMKIFSKEGKGTNICMILESALLGA